MSQPNPDHPIAISRSTKRVRVFAGDQQIADSANALVLQEAQYPPVYYIPRGDADMTALTRTEKSTHCPYKGDASYFSLTPGNGALANAVWSYEAPIATVAQIAGHLAFYQDKVRIDVA